jgi:hypothetical protein
MPRRLKKFFHTLRIAYYIIMARTFGDYVHTIGGYGQPDFLVYRYREHDYWIPN